MTKFFFTTLLLLNTLATGVFAQTNNGQPIMTKKYDSSTNRIHWPDEFNPLKSKWFVYNEIEVFAKPEVVWNILVDAKNWHTYYEGAQSPIEYLDTNATTLKNGLTFKFHTMGLHLLPVVKEFTPNERLAWEVRRGDLKGYHAWVIVKTESGCRLITAESQNGFLTWMQKIFQPNKLLSIHDKWLRLIKEKAEKK